MTALVVKDDFKTVTSDLSDELCFTLDGDPTHRGKVRNLIEPIRTYRPKKIEIWVFKDYHTVMRRASFSSNEGPNEIFDQEESSESEILQPFQQPMEKRKSKTYIPNTKYGLHK